VTDSVFGGDMEKPQIGSSFLCSDDGMNPPIQ
jgi:hypothetical protein